MRDAAPRARRGRGGAHRGRLDRAARWPTRPRSPTTRDAGGYDQETVWDSCTIAALGIPFERAKYRAVTSLSGGEQKRLALEALLRGPEQVLLLDEPDNYLDVPGKRWLEDSLRATPKTVLLVSHDRELLARAADRIITLELGAAGNTVWTHGGGFGSYHEARRRPHGPARRAASAAGTSSTPRSSSSSRR